MSGVEVPVRRVTEAHRHENMPAHGGICNFSSHSAAGRPGRQKLALIAACTRVGSDLIRARPAGWRHSSLLNLEILLSAPSAGGPAALIRACCAVTGWLAA